MNRRSVWFFLVSLATMPTAPQFGHAAASPLLSVYRNPGCGCCGNWAQLMAAAGFQVSIEDDPDLTLRHRRLGIPDVLAGCHIALIDGFVIEGHVPPADVKRFLAERPAGAIGLAVPGMPAGSPGMGPEGSGKPYDVLLIKANAETIIYARH